MLPVRLCRQHRTTANPQRVCRNGQTGRPIQKCRKTYDQPFKSAVEDLRRYSDKCLNVRVSRGPNYQSREAATSTTYTPKLETVGTGKAMVSVQEKYQGERANSGAPPDGLFVLVAEARAAKGTQTQLTIYHVSRGLLADPLKRWAEGDKSSCPSF